MPAEPAAGRRRRARTGREGRPPRASGPVGRAEAVWRSFSGLGAGARRAVPRRLADAVADPAQLPAAGRARPASASRSATASACCAALALGLPRAADRRADRLRRNATWAAAAVAAVVVVAFSWRAAEWQNSIRERVDMPPVAHRRTRSRSWRSPPSSSLVLILLGRLFLWVCAPRPPPAGAPRPRARLAGRRPRRRGRAVLGHRRRRAAPRLPATPPTSSFATRDALIEPEYPAPADPLGTGSAASLIDWEELGRAGREFVASGPTRRADRRLHRPPGRAAAPGLCRPELRRRPSRPARELALDELIRVGAFDRSVLVVAVPTGTGWMDPAAMDTLEYLHGGDTAIVGGAVLLPDQLDLAAGRARLRHRDRPGAVPRRLRPLDRAAARRPAAALPLRPQPRRLRLRAVVRGCTR